jgi:hypothetical protein
LIGVHLFMCVNFGDIRFTLDSQNSDYRGLEYRDKTSLCTINLFDSDYKFEAY